VALSDLQKVKKKEEKPGRGIGEDQDDLLCSHAPSAPDGVAPASLSPLHRSPLATEHFADGDDKGSAMFFDGCENEFLTLSPYKYPDFNIS
jgi:hypothetical protein